MYAFYGVFSLGVGFTVNVQISNVLLEVVPNTIGSCNFSLPSSNTESWKEMIG